MQAYLWDFRAYLNRMPHGTGVPDVTLRELTAMYLGSVGWVDDLVGRLLATLHATGSGVTTP